MPRPYFQKGHIQRFRVHHSGCSETATWEVTEPRPHQAPTGTLGTFIEETRAPTKGSCAGGLELGPRGRSKWGRPHLRAGGTEPWLTSRALLAPGWPEARHEGASRRPPRVGGLSLQGRGLPTGREAALSALSPHTLSWSTLIRARAPPVQKCHSSKAALRSQFRPFTFLTRFKNSFGCFPFFYHLSLLQKNLRRFPVPRLERGVVPAHVDPTPARPGLGSVPGQLCPHQVSHILGPGDTRPQPRSLVPLSLPGRRVLPGGLGTPQLWPPPVGPALTHPLPVVQDLQWAWTRRATETRTSAGCPSETR